jgi:hypothetical protein
MALFTKEVIRGVIDRPKPPTNVNSVEEYIFWCKNHASKHSKLRGFSRVEQVADTLPIDQQLSFYSYVANTHYSLDQIANSTGMNPVETGINIIAAMRTIRSDSSVQQLFKVGDIFEMPSGYDDVQAILEFATFDEAFDTLAEMKSREQPVQGLVDDMMSRPTDQFIEQFGLPIDSFDVFNHKSFALNTITDPQLYNSSLDAYRAYKTAAYLYSRGMTVVQVGEQLKKLYPNYTNSKLWFKNRAPTGSVPRPIEDIRIYEEKHPGAFNLNNANNFMQNGIGPVLAYGLITANSTSLAGRWRGGLYQMNGEVVDILDGMNTNDELLLNRVGDVDIRRKKIDFTNVYIRNILMLMNDPDAARELLTYLPVSAQKDIATILISEGYHSNVSRVVEAGGKVPVGYVEIVYNAVTNVRHEILNWVYKNLHQSRAAYDVTYSRWKSAVNAALGIRALTIKIADLDNTLDAIERIPETANSVNAWDMQANLLTNKLS